MPFLDLVRSIALDVIAPAVGDPVTAKAPHVLAARQDGWVNPTTGLGTSRDKTVGGWFGQGCWLSDQALADLYTYDDLSATIVDAGPREELRLGFGLKGLDPQNLIEVDRYLKRYDLVRVVLDARRKGRHFGGSAIWLIVDDGLDPQEPLDVNKIKSVLGVRVIDRRWLIPQTYYLDAPGNQRFTEPRVGDPELYLVQEPHPGGVGTSIGYIHESRLITFPGDPTESLLKIRLKGWDASCLLRVYEALRQAGETWKAIELLVVDGNQGVYKVSKLWDKIAGDVTQGVATTSDPTGGGTFLKRVQIMDRVKSVFRAIVLDKDDEDYERQTMSYSGLPDLSDKAWLRVSAAARIPVSVLTGGMQQGLNNQGDLPLTRWYNECESNRRQIDEPRILRLLRVLLSAQDAPEINFDASDVPVQSVPNARDDAEEEGASTTPDAEAGDALDKLELVWEPLWAPTAAELADIRLKRQQEAQIMITTQQILPEEAVLSLPPDWWNAVDRNLRRQSLEEDREALLTQRNAAKLAQGEATIAQANQAKEIAENPPDPTDVAERTGSGPVANPKVKADMPDNTKAQNATGRTTKKNASV